MKLSLSQPLSSGRVCLVCQGIRGSLVHLEHREDRVKTVEKDHKETPVSLVPGGHLEKWDWKE